jgi:hypothetical protein
MKRTPLPPIKPGSVWIDNRVSFLKGEGRSTEVRVMVIAENYVMVRFPRAMPFVIGETEFRKGFALKSDQTGAGG